MLISPSGLPQIRLSYTKTNVNGTILEKSVVDGETFTYPPYPNSLIFEIDDMGKRKELNYDIAKNELLNEESYAMKNFELLKLNNNRLIYVGTLHKTDMEEVSYKIKLTGELYYESFNTLPHLTFPEL